MNVKKIRELASALFNEAPYLSNITNPVEHEKAITLVEEIFVNNHEEGIYDEREILVSALCSAIKRYEESAPEFAVFNARLAELDASVDLISDYEDIILIEDRKTQPEIEVKINDL